MGRLQAGEMAGHAPIDVALHWHLICNHYPPLPTAMVETSKEAIQACNEGDSRREIALPESMKYKGRDTAPAGNIVDFAHLEEFLEEGVEYYID